MTMYQSSKGAVEISTMPLPYAKNALAKLMRDEPHRTDEIEAIDKHVTALAAELDENPRVVIGGNNPPANEVTVATPQTWAAIKINMDDLLEQAQGITGIAIAEQRGADQAGKLLRDLQTSMRAAEDARVAEKAPLDEAVKAIQDRYNEYIAPIKNKTPGLMSKAEVALKNQIAAWLKKQDDERIARENAARIIAEKAADDARAAHQEAVKSDDMESFSAAEDLMAAAEEAALDLKRAEKAKTQVAVGDHRAISLRSVWKAERIEGQGGKALGHFAKTQPDRVIAFIQTLADECVRAGARGDALPGFNIREEKVV